MISGGIAGEHEAIDTPQLSADEMAAVIETAHAWGRKVTAHAGPAAVIDEAVRLGLDCVEHGYQLTADVARLMAERGVSLVPTLVVTRCGEFFDELGVPEWMQQRSLGAGAPPPGELPDGARGRRRGDAGQRHAAVLGVRGDHGHRARAGVHDRGRTRRSAAALQAATIGPARWLGVDADLGTLEVGKRADLVALAADPLADTTAWRTIGFVMKGGAVVRDDGWAA